ncbi:restriction endonuclease subunit S [Intestinibacter bartlettii]|uniref:restriction endonuclease subunit S n=1 Tax=Intestinibacter bartlettii TaxID=261299 RepID=UPI0006BF1F69|nr:restriction endonuclease subunit S [Intestinibacter bartlettii]CUO73736.1 restriction endonuclease S subunit [Intestinibacter bartlettii]
MSCSEWKEYRLDEIGDIVSGGTPSTKNEDYYGNEIPWITPKDLSGYDSKYISKGERSITKLGLEKSSAKLLPKGTILFSSRAPIGYVAIAQEDLCTNQGFKNIVCNPQVAHNEFIYYRMKLAKEELESVAGGSTFKEVSGKVMKEFKIKLPSIEQQKRIASILSSLDDKIELNNEMNKTLEEMAQSIFKRWFVDFEFPNEDGQPYKSSGGEMVESELAMIPKGWEVKSLDEILDSISIKHKFPNEKIIFLNTSDILDGEVLHNNYSDVSSLPGQAKKSIQKGDILYSEIRPKNKRYTFIDFDADEYVVSTKLMVLRTKNKFNSSMMYFYLSNESTVNYLQTIAEGRSGTFPQITFNELKKLKICMPTNDTIVELGKFFENILKTINNNKKEAKQLKEMRDILLLKLMSGEIRV